MNNQPQNQNKDQSKQPVVVDKAKTAETATAPAVKPVVAAKSSNA